MIQTSKHSTVQILLIRYATEAGWSHLSLPQALHPCESENAPFSRRLSLEAVQRLNPGRPDTNRAKSLVRQWVIVHELLHLKIPRHGPLFKALEKAYLRSPLRC